MKAPTDDSLVVEKAFLVEGGYSQIVITTEASTGVSRDYVINVVNDDGNPHFLPTTSVFEENAAYVVPGQTVAEVKADINTMNCLVLITDNEGVLKRDDAPCVDSDIIIIKSLDNKLVYRANVIIEGDVNQDGAVNDADIEMLINHILEISTLSIRERELADMNQDGYITIADVGLIKALTNVDWIKQSEKADIALSAPESLHNQESFDITLLPSVGTYYAEGYLTYNEGRIEAQNAENSGRIHFITDGTNVFFDNGESSVSFKPVTQSGNAEIGIEIEETYDYAMRRQIFVSIDSSTRYIQSDDLNVTITLRSKRSDGLYGSAHVTITNTDDKSIGNILLNLGDYFVLSNGESTQKLAGLKSGNSHDIAICPIDNLTAGIYNSTITIKYQDAECVEKMMSLPITFAIDHCDHNNAEWTIKNNTHASICYDCGQEIAEEHVYVNIATGSYECAVCGDQKVVELRMTNDDLIVGESVKFAPDIYINDELIDPAEMAVRWYIDGQLVGETYELETTFDYVGRATIDCVVTLNNGISLISSSNNRIGQKEGSEIEVASILCGTIVLKSSENCEYRIGDGRWQTTPIFTGLTPDVGYTVYQREIGSTKIASLKVKPSHNVLQYELINKCEADVIRTGVCVECDHNIENVIPNTAQAHAFVEYRTGVATTCSQEGTLISYCARGCGELDTIKLVGFGSHLYLNYKPISDEDCKNGQLVSAECVYGCGAVDMTPNKESFGHYYIYTANDNATTGSSMTETGICQHCGKRNTRKIVGTRIPYVDQLNVTMVLSITQPICLPQITVAPGMIVQEAVWEASDGTLLDGKDASVVLKSGEVYRLVKLVLVSDGTCAIHEKTSLYINDAQFAGKPEVVDENTIIFTNIGQFKA
jgi:hypothetical protein